MPYKRKAPGAYIGGRPYKRRRVTRRMNRNMRGRIVGRTRTRRGTRPNFKFHRWITAFQTGTGTLVNVTDCTYDGADSFITCTNPAKTAQFSLGFQLRDIPNVTEFTSLFDSYMLTGVMLQFKLIDNPGADFVTGDPTTYNKLNFYPTIWYAPDHDDNNNVPIGNIKEFERVRHKVLYPNREVNIMLRPTTLGQLFLTSTTSAVTENRRRSWLDMATTNIPHYGFKSVIDFEGISPSANFRIKVNAKYYFTCKNVR